MDEQLIVTIHEFDQSDFVRDLDASSVLPTSTKTVLGFDGQGLLQIALSGSTAVAAAISPIIISWIRKRKLLKLRIGDRVYEGFTAEEVIEIEKCLEKLATQRSNKRPPAKDQTSTNLPS